MKVFYNPNMSTPSHGYSPSGSKPAAAVADWQAHNLDIEIVDFEPATESDLCLAHDPKFVRGVMSRKMTNGHGNRLKSVTDSCLWTVGSMVAASRAALTDGITCSPTSGFHHAGYNYNGAFCTYNGLIVAARKMINEGLVKTIGIIDCDMHYGDGTEDILQKIDTDYRIKHWTFGAEFGGRRKDFNSDDLLKQLGYALAAMRIDGVELIIYQAGADPHINDPLGGVMTTDEMLVRDAFVLRTCRDLGMAVAWNFAGGYQVDDDGGISKVLELHRNTAVEAIAVLNKTVSDVPVV